jgi:hypothetical protein
MSATSKVVFTDTMAAIAGATAPKTMTASTKPLTEFLKFVIILVFNRELNY